MIFDMDIEKLKKDIKTESTANKKAKKKVTIPLDDMVNIFFSKKNKVTP